MTAGFLEVLALYCLLSDSPDLLCSEQDLVEKNQTVVNRGRAPNALHYRFNWVVSHRRLGTFIYCKMQDCAQLLDQTYATDLYGSALAVMQARIDEVDETLSAHVIDDTLKHGGTWSFGSHMAQLHAESYEQHELSVETLKHFEQLAAQSLQQQEKLEQDTKISF